MKNLDMNETIIMYVIMRIDITYFIIYNFNVTYRYVLNQLYYNLTS